MTNNRKIYTLTICYNEEEDRVEWIEESIAREEELPENIHETKDLEELKDYLKKLPKVTIVGEA